jgi:hypothetical protein
MRTYLWPVVAFLVVVAAGCATVPLTTIEAHERNVLLPSARIGWNLTPRSETPSRPADGHGLEFTAYGGSGTDTQELVSGQLPVESGGQTFLAPQTLQHDFDVRVYQLAWRWRQFLADPVGLEVIAGAGYTRLDLEVSSASQRASESLSSTGVVAGIGALWRVRPSTTLHARVEWFGSADSNGITEADRMELSLAQAIGRHVVARVGYARSAFYSERSESAGLSDIELDLRGPLLGVELQF